MKRIAWNDDIWWEMSRRKYISRLRFDSNMRHLLRNWNFWRKNLSIYNHYSIILKDSRISRFLESNFQTTDNSSLDIRVSQKWNLLEPNAWSNKRVTLLPSIHRWKTTVKQPLDELICVRHATGAVQQSDKGRL